jgi:hypothetical protein
MEAVGHGVLMRRARGLFVTDPSHIKILRLTSPPDPQLVEKLTQSIATRLGKAYSRWGAGRTFVPFIPYEPEHATFCSRLVLEGFRDNDIDLLPGIPTDKIWPKHFESSPILTDITDRAVQRLHESLDKEEYDMVMSYSGTTMEEIGVVLGRRVIELLRPHLSKVARNRLHSFLDLLNWLNEKVASGESQSLERLDGALHDALHASSYLSFLGGDLPTQRNYLQSLKLVTDAAESFEPAQFDAQSRDFGEWLQKEQDYFESIRKLNRETEENIRSLATATGLHSLGELASVYADRAEIGTEQHELLRRLSQRLIGRGQ